MFRPIKKIKTGRKFISNLSSNVLLVSYVMDRLNVILFGLVALIR